MVTLVGRLVGRDVGKLVGVDVGEPVGVDVGRPVGTEVGMPVGKPVGSDVGVGLAGVPLVGAGVDRFTGVVVAERTPGVLPDPVVPGDVGLPGITGAAESPLPPSGGRVVPAGADDEGDGSAGSCA